jgi:hypothetical protein
MRFVRAIQGKKNSVIYFSAKGDRLICRNGTWAWRNNNPGNIIKGLKARKLGSIGTAGGFAVFPDYETGREIAGGRLRSYDDFRYVPPSVPPQRSFSSTPPLMGLR